MQLASFRKHWLLIILIVIGLLWWRIYDLLIPSPQLPNWYDSSQSFDYWSMISHPEIGWIALAGFIIIWILVFIRMWRISRIAHRYILMIATMLICAIFTCAPIILSTKDSRTIEHVMSVTYQGHVYHLAFYKFVEFMDMGSSSYYVFECDASGNKCTRINEEAGGPPYQAKLVVSENKLIYQYDTRSYQILPKVTGSS